MKRTEIIAQIRSLRESQADFVRTNGDEIFKRDVEALDTVIDFLNQTHGAYDDWEVLRKIQEKGESNNAES